MELEILKYLNKNNSESFSILEISKELNLDYKNCFNKIKKLAQLNLVSLTKIGNTNQIKFNYLFCDKTLLVEHSKKEDLFKEKNFKIIEKRIKELNYPFLIVLVFGSYAKNTNDKHSDIDLCVICDNDKVIKKLFDKLRLLPLDIDLNEFSVSEFKSMIDTKKVNVSSEIISNNVILFGVENFYSLFNN